MKPRELRNLSAEELTKVEDLQNQIPTLDKEIEARKKFLNTTVTELETDTTVAETIEKGRQEQRGDEDPEVEERRRIEINDDNRHRFESLGHQLRAVARAAIYAGTMEPDSRLLYWTKKQEAEARASGMSISQPADGGHAVDELH